MTDVNSEIRNENPSERAVKMYSFNFMGDYIELSDGPLTEERLPYVANIAKNLAFTFASTRCPQREAELKDEAAREDGGRATFGKNDPGFLATFNVKTQEIVCEKDIIEIFMFSSLVHENTHASSYLNLSRIKTKDGCKEEIFSGIKKTSILLDEEEDRIIDAQILNKALNEGITEFLTIRAKAEYGFKIKSVGCYPFNVFAAKQLEAVVGSELINSAYYAGDINPLIDRVNTLLERADGWEAFNQKLDIACQLRKTAFSSEYNEEEKYISAIVVEIMLEKMNLARIKETNVDKSNDIDGNNDIVEAFMKKLSDIEDAPSEDEGIQELVVRYVSEKRLEIKWRESGLGKEHFDKWINMYLAFFDDFPYEVAKHYLKFFSDKSFDSEYSIISKITTKEEHKEALIDSFFANEPRTPQDVLRKKYINYIYSKAKEKYNEGMQQPLSE